jgi:hypothetical protein
MKTLRPLGLLGSLLFCASFSLAACDVEDPAQAESDLTACQGARKDTAGRCRLSNGRFAKASCCAPAALSDAEIEAQLGAAIAGLTTGGSEGDPDPYELYVFDLDPGTELTCGFLAPNLIPRMPEFLIEPGDSDYIQDCDVEDLEQFWADVTAEPNADELYPEDLPAAQAAAKQWGEVRAFMEQHLQGRGYFLVGYRYGADGSLETGAVSHTIFGRSATGRVFVIAGIDIWT